MITIGVQVGVRVTGLGVRVGSGVHVAVCVAVVATVGVLVLGIGVRVGSGVAVGAGLPSVSIASLQRERSGKK